MNYIPVDELIAEIEKALKASELHRGEAAVDGSRQTLYWIKDFIVSHQYQEPKDRWKPSEEQLNYVNWAYSIAVAENNTKAIEVLGELHDTLLNLMQ